MNTSDTLKHTVDSALSWFLKKLTLNSNGQLEILITESTLSSDKDKVEFDGVDFGNLKRIEISNNSKEIKILFKDVLAFQRFDESFLIGHENESFEGKYFRTYSKSNYLDFLLKQTSLEVWVKSKAVHYSIVCENDVIDIISEAPPVVVQVDSIA